MITADADALREAFTAEADVLARQVLVTAQVPDAVTADEATVAVTLAADAGDARRREAFAQRPRRRRPARPRPPTAAPTTDRGPGDHPDLAATAASPPSASACCCSWSCCSCPGKAKPLTPEERAAAYTDRLVGRHAGRGQRPSTTRR